MLALRAVLLVLLTPTLSFAYAVGPANESTLRYDQNQHSETAQESSAANRVGKQFMFTVQPIGYVVAPLPSAGLNVGYFINPNAALQVEATFGKLDYQNSFNIEARTLGVNLKAFMGNSFYVKGGIAYRDLALTDVRCIDCTDRNWGSSQVVAGEFAIGNQWQFETFTLGCDWVGAMIPAVQLRGQQVGEGSGLSFAKRRDTNELWDRVSKTTNVSLLRFYLGASF